MAEADQPVRMRLVRRRSATDAFPELTDGFKAAAYALPLSPAGRVYYSSFLSDADHGHDFALVDDAGALAIVICNDGSAGPLACYDSAIEIWQRPQLSPLTERRIVREVLGELARIAPAAGFLVRTSERVDRHGIWAARLADLNGRPSVAVRAQLDLDAGDDVLLADMRKGHRQQIRWGAEHLELRFVDHAQPDRSLFEDYQHLHGAVAGRITRPPESWDRMYELIADGRGDLILTYLDDELVGGALILDSWSVAHYASGANRREYFDKPISHYPLFVAAQRARARGRIGFDMGETIGGSIDPTDPKQCAIGRFKAGFSGTARVSTIWAVPGKDSGTRED